MRSAGTASIAIVALLLGALLVLPACDETTSVSPDDDLIVNLTDEAANLRELDSVEIGFDRVEVAPVRGVSRRLPIVLPDNPVDLLGLGRARGVVPLASGEVGEGTFRGFRIVLDESVSRVVESDGDRRDLELGREEVEVPFPFRVEEDRITRITLELDLSVALVRRDGSWFLDPVFTASERE